jgi:hypothetical protein
MAEIGRPASGEAGGNGGSSDSGSSPNDVVWVFLFGGFMSLVAALVSTFVPPPPSEIDYRMTLFEAYTATESVTAATESD